MSDHEKNEAFRKEIVSNIVADQVTAEVAGALRAIEEYVADLHRRTREAEERALGAAVRADRASAMAKQFENDWVAAKHEFGVTTSKLRAELAAMKDNWTIATEHNVKLDLMLMQAQRDLVTRRKVHELFDVSEAVTRARTTALEAAARVVAGVRDEAVRDWRTELDEAAGPFTVEQLDALVGVVAGVVHAAVEAIRAIQVPGEAVS